VELRLLAYTVAAVPYEYAENEYEAEPQASGGRSLGPPRKWTGVGVLDPPVPPKRLPGPAPETLAPLLFRIFAGLLLAGLVAVTLFMLFAKH